MKNNVAVIGKCMLEVSSMGAGRDQSSLPAGWTSQDLLDTK